MLTPKRRERLESLQAKCDKLAVDINKAFNPDESRDSHGRWSRVGRAALITAGTIGTVALSVFAPKIIDALIGEQFHATQLNSLAGILKDGIVPDKTVPTEALERMLPERRGWSFVTTSMERAKHIQKHGRPHEGEKLSSRIIIKLKVPKGEFLRNFQNEGIPTGYMHKGIIPPDWIEGVYSKAWYVHPCRAPSTFEEGA